MAGGGGGGRGAGGGEDNPPTRDNFSPPYSNFTLTFTLETMQSDAKPNSFSQ